MTEPQYSSLVCANHPERETLLRCNRCDKPICNDCAVLTPTGYRCKECVRGQQRVFETAHTRDIILAAAIALVFSFLGSFIVPVMQFFTIFIAPIVGMIASEVIRRVSQRRRSQLFFRLAAAGAVVGGLPLLANGLLNLAEVMARFGIAGIGAFLPLIWQAVYLFLVTSTLYYRLSGIRL